MIEVRYTTKEERDGWFASIWRSIYITHPFSHAVRSGIFSLVIFNLIFGIIVGSITPNPHILIFAATFTFSVILSAFLHIGLNYLSEKYGWEVVEPADPNLINLTKDRKG